MIITLTKQKGADWVRSYDEARTGNKATLIKIDKSLGATDAVDTSIKIGDKKYDVAIETSREEGQYVLLKGDQELPDGIYRFDTDQKTITKVNPGDTTTLPPPTFPNFALKRKGPDDKLENYVDKARDAFDAAFKPFLDFINAEPSVSAEGVKVGVPAPSLFSKGGSFNTELNDNFLYAKNYIKIDKIGTFKERIEKLNDSNVQLPIFETLVKPKFDECLKAFLTQVNVGDRVTNDGIDFYQKFQRLPREVGPEGAKFNKNESADKVFIDNVGLIADKMGLDGAQLYYAAAFAKQGENPFKGTSLDKVGPPVGEESARISVDVSDARGQIVATLSTLLAQVDDPKDLSGAAQAALATSDFKKNGVFYKEIKEDIDKIKLNSLPITFGDKFRVRAAAESLTFQASNQLVCADLESKALEKIKKALAETQNNAALTLLSAGAQGKLEAESDDKKLYDAVIGFAGLFDIDVGLIEFLKETTIDTSTGVVTAPPTASSSETQAADAPSAPAGGPTVPSAAPVPGAAPTTGAPGDVSTDATGVGTASAGSSQSGDAQPGAPAEVSDIAVAAVRILNARPVPVQVFMDFGPPRSADIEQPLPLQWTIDPAYFSGYQLQINDSQRATIAQYKNQQVILRVSATPLTGGRPVEVKQPLPVRTYRLPDQAELIPIKTFTFGRLAGTQAVSSEPAAQGGARDFSKRVAEVPCFFYKDDGGVGTPSGDTVGVTSSASGRTYRFDFPEGFLVPIRIKFDEAKNTKTAAKLDALRKEQGLVTESRGKILKEAGVPHWIFLKRRGALDSGRGGAGGAGGEGADADAAGGLRVNIAVKTIVISTTDKLRVVGNTGNPWDSSSFKAAFYPGKGAQFVKDEFPNAGLILCDDDFGFFSGLDKGEVMKAMYRVLFTDRAPSSSAYKLMGLQRWSDDIRVVGSNPEVSATARRKPDNLFAAS